MNLARLRAALQEALAALEDPEAPPSGRQPKPRRRRVYEPPRVKLTPERERAARERAAKRGIPL